MWLYTPSNALPESACSASDCTPGSDTWASRLAPSVTLSGRLSPPASWRRAWPKAPWMTRLSGPTLPASTLQHGVDQWIASLAASRAKTCPLQAAAQGWTESAAGSSSTSCALPKIAVRDTSFWRTSQASLLPPPPLWTKPKANSKSAQPPESWENWPTAGGTRNGSLFQRPTWAPATGGLGGFAGRGGWATPDCNTSTYSNGKMGPNLREQAASWNANSAATNSQNAADATDAPTANATGWPTPRGTDGTKGGPNQAGSKGEFLAASIKGHYRYSRV